jgi:hypothetical protein
MVSFSSTGLEKESAQFSQADPEVPSAPNSHRHRSPPEGKTMVWVLGGSQQKQTMEAQVHC